MISSASLLRASGHVCEPDVGLDAGARGDRQDESFELGGGHGGCQRGERVGQPGYAPATAQHEIVPLLGIFEREPKHRPQRRFVFGDLASHLGEHELESSVQIGGRVVAQHRCLSDLGVGGEQERLLGREVAVGRGT